MEFVLLKLKIPVAKGGILADRWYYYQVPTFEYAADGTTVVLMTQNRARQIFLTDPDNYKKLLPDLPSGCSNWVDLDGLIIPLPDIIVNSVFVERVNYRLRADGSFDILAELKNAVATDSAYVEIMGLEGTAWSQTGLYKMAVLVQTFPETGGLKYSFSKTFSGLKAGDTVRFMVHANQQLEGLSDIIRMQNTNPTKGPVWGSWKPKLVGLGADYFETLPDDAATGTGLVNYNLIAAPAWYIFAQNTRNIGANPTPSVAPAVAETVTFRAFDSVGATDKTFTLEYSGLLDMFMGWGYQVNNEQLALGIGPNDDQPFKVKLTALSVVTPAWTNTAQYTATHELIGLAAITYPWQLVYMPVKPGVYQAEVTRHNGQVRYALIEITATTGTWSVPLSPTKPVYNPVTGHPVSFGDIWEVVATSAQVVERYIQIAPVTEGGAAKRAQLMLKLSDTSIVAYAGNDLTWTITQSPSNLITLNPQTGDLLVPLNSISADGEVSLKVTDGQGTITTGKATILNVAPSGAKPVRQVKRENIEVILAGDRTYLAPAGWFAPAGVLKAQKYLPGTLTLVDLDSSIISFDVSTGTIMVKAGHPNGSYVIHQTSTNEFGQAFDDILLTVNRSTAPDVIVVQYRIDIAPVIEGGGQQLPVLMQLLYPTGERKYPGNDIVWGKAAGHLAAVVVDPVTGATSLPLNSISANTTFSITATIPDGVVNWSVQLLNVDPQGQKPVLQGTGMDDIYVNTAGTQSRFFPANWFNPGGVLAIYKWNGTTKSPLDSALIVQLGSGGTITIPDSYPNTSFPILVECTNAFGTDVDVFQFKVERPSAVGKITGIWRSFIGNQLNYYVHGDLLSGSEKWRVEYRQTPAGTYNGAVSTDWSPYRLACTPGTATVGSGDFYRSYGNNGQGIQTHLEFRVVNTETNAVVGPTLSFDFTIPFADAVINPTLLYQP